MPSQDVLSRIRADLERERHELRGQLEEQGIDFDENFADSGQVAAEQGENKVLAGQLREQIDEIEHALAKIDAGTYGTCEVCGNAIAEPRLEAMPATRYCIEHA
jgi:DnaK suppressor protein